jgi:hypothetical protein
MGYNMELNLSETKKQLLTGFLLIILPLILIGLGLITDFRNAWFYIVAIAWFTLGVIFFHSIYD